MKFKKTESGRSMVEMLGVLAIIGVLSVGGIAGYSLSMRRHRANGVVDAMSKYGLIIYGQCQQKVLNGDATKVDECEDSDLSTFENAGIGSLPAGVTTIGGGSLYPVRDDTDEKGSGVYVHAYFSDKKLCQAVASIGGTSCHNNTNGDWTHIFFKQN